MTDAVVEIQQVSKTFDELTAVNDVSLTVGAGQTLGLIGPNGAGKTTLLRLIATLAKPDTGDVRVLGTSVRDSPRSVRRMLGFMPAEFGSPRHLSIGEYLDYFGCVYGVSHRERAGRIRDVCELTDLTGREQVMVGGLSTGNRQRLLLAKTLLHDPDLLILDEPASGLDPRARNELRSIVRTLASMGKTIIISSHILPDIEDISDHIGIMEAGRLVLDGNLQELRTQPGAAQRQFRLRVPPDQQDSAAATVSALAGVSRCDVDSAYLIVHTDGLEGNRLLRELLEQNIVIRHFSEEEANLEEIFMRSTAGKVT